MCNVYIFFVDGLGRKMSEIVAKQTNVGDEGEVDLKFKSRGTWELGEVEGYL